ncbi:hypothetical protein PgNI_05881 [Pyricularia grisea]|uniref:Uncharacterized protein n=1 Tax=Pyricularia grisea TaxID=148305 RepID=A0A6P8B6V6_PYRGI|nr:hypothetical protein PgNI_05881 [Pyricularia grisea]TLD11047.1 hypothetical protein PgNI_05881 [Pyricularia grisea]
MTEQDIITVLCDPHLVATETILAPHQLKNDETSTGAGNLPKRVPPETTIKPRRHVSTFRLGDGRTLRPGLLVGAIVGAPHAPAALLRARAVPPRLGVEVLEVVEVLQLQLRDGVDGHLLRYRGGHAGGEEEGGLDGVVRPDDGRCSGQIITSGYVGLRIWQILVVEARRQWPSPGQNVDHGLAEVPVVPLDEFVVALGLDVLKGGEEDGVAEAVLGQ